MDNIINENQSPQSPQSPQELIINEMQKTILDQQNQLKEFEVFKNDLANQTREIFRNFTNQNTPEKDTRTTEEVFKNLQTKSNLSFAQTIADIARLNELTYEKENRYIISEQTIKDLKDINKKYDNDKLKYVALNEYIRKGVVI